MNFSVDDTDPSIVYSDGWDVQSPSDPDLDRFFKHTYHVAVQDGASFSFQFIGSAFALYGSKGPGHTTQYQLQFDNTVVNLDASASTTAYQQELFSHTFATDGQTSQHSVKVTASLQGTDRWLDVDYITFTNGNGTTSSVATATSNPPWLTVSSQSASSASGASPFSTSASAASSSSSSSHSNLSTILAIVFGALIGLAILGLIVWLFLRRILAKRRARERAFRYGQSSVNPSSYAASAAATSASRPLSPPTSTMREYPNPMGAAVYTRVEPGEGSLSSGQGVEMRSLSIEREQERERGNVTPSTSRPLLSQSPIAWTTRKMGGHKGDADSLRTDFLQV